MSTTRIWVSSKTTETVAAAGVAERAAALMVSGYNERFDLCVLASAGCDRGGGSICADVRRSWIGSDEPPITNDSDTRSVA